MKQISFAELPVTARVVLALAAFNLWWSFEEFVVDRSGIWRYLPDYKVGRLCIWDLTVATLLAALTWQLSRKSKQAN